MFLKHELLVYFKDKRIKMQPFSQNVYNFFKSVVQIHFFGWFFFFLGADSESTLIFSPLAHI